MAKYVYRPLEVDAYEISNSPDVPDLNDKVLVIEAGRENVVYTKEEFEERFVEAE